MLISCLAEVKRRGGETRTIGLFGQELITITAAIARMNLVIHGVADFQISSGNTLTAPTFVKGDELRIFDVILANPPYSIKKWNRTAWEKDAWGRNSSARHLKGERTTPSSSTSCKAWTRRRGVARSFFRMACSSARKRPRCGKN